MNFEQIKSLTSGERSRRIRDMFCAINSSYDFLNHTLSLWQDVRWRNFAVKRAGFDAKSVLDICTGTGDVAIKLARGPERHVAALDFTGEMIARALIKARKEKLEGKIHFSLGDALKLPFKGAQFDAVTMAFGLRNITDRLAALCEMKRVLKPGGKILILEMTLPRKGLRRRFFKFYLESVVPTVGGLLSGKREAYGYLRDSIEDFLTPEQLNECFRMAGITNVKAHPLSFGITFLHEATV